MNILHNPYSPSTGPFARSSTLHKLSLKAPTRPTPQDQARFGHGGGDHFHPMPPFEVYGKSNPFFVPMVTDLLKPSDKLFFWTRFCEEWITNPEVDGVNNLKSLHLLLSRDSLEKTWELLPAGKKPKGYRLGYLKTLSSVLSVTPFTKWRTQAKDAYQLEKKQLLDTLFSDLQRNRIFPMLYYGVLTQTPDRHLRTEAARLLIWDYIVPYQPQEDASQWIDTAAGKAPTDWERDQRRWGRLLTHAFLNIFTPEADSQGLPVNMTDIAKVMTAKDIAWPHDAYAEKQATAKAAHDHDHDHAHDHTHGGHSHQGIITIHRQKDWDHPQKLARVIGEKLMVLPLSQPLRPVVQTLLSETPPTDWMQQLFAAMKKWPKA